MVELDLEKQEEDEKKMTVEERTTRSLMAIRQLQKKDFWMVVEQEWEKNVNMIVSFVERRQVRVISLTNEIYQLVGFSAAFQGLLLTRRRRRLSCRARPSGGCSCCPCSPQPSPQLTFGARLRVVPNTLCYSIARLQAAMHKEEPYKKSIMRMILNLRRQGPEGFDFNREAQDRERLLVPPEVTCFPKLVRFVSAECSYNSTIFYRLIIFGILCVLSTQYILCD